MSKARAERLAKALRAIDVRSIVTGSDNGVLVRLRNDQADTLLDRLPPASPVDGRLDVTTLPEWAALVEADQMLPVIVETGRPKVTDQTGTPPMTSTLPPVPEEPRGFDPYAMLDYPDLAKAHGVHDGKRTIPCLCTRDDSSSSHDSQHPGEYRNDYGDWETCGWCDGRAFRYADCTRCDGSGLEPADPAPSSPDKGTAARDVADAVDSCPGCEAPLWLDNLTVCWNCGQTLIDYGPEFRTAPTPDKGTGRPPHAWLNGNCVAMLHDLPDGTDVADDLDAAGQAVSDVTILFRRYFVDAADRSGHNRPVLVLSCADGTTPTPSARPDTRQMRADAVWLRNQQFGMVAYTKADRIDDTADWIDAHAPTPPATPTQTDIADLVERLYDANGFDDINYHQAEVRGLLGEAGDALAAVYQPTEPDPATPTPQPDGGR